MRRSTHVLARVSLACAVLGLLLNGLLGSLRYLVGPPADALAIDNIAVNGVLGLVASALGVETFIKHRWPGSSVIARAAAPGGKDLNLATAAIALTVINAILCLRWINSIAVAG